ncbi:hypothetical protein LTR94_013075 [Friedmanniomyces endolithicus]|nr:hypothetical protein LTR94_013075 [Friedmanniomyces endolithicus]
MDNDQGGSMISKSRAQLMALLLLPTAAQAAESGTIAVPEAVLALNGCWQGEGNVMGKPVPLDAMLALDVESSALADPKDRYAAHLIFGGTEKSHPIIGFWADSFGGAFTALGEGESQPDGFDIDYAYPDATFVNRWRIKGAQLTWDIVARDEANAEKPFASYSLHKVACAPAKTR